MQYIGQNLIVWKIDNGCLDYKTHPEMDNNKKIISVNQVREGQEVNLFRVWFLLLWSK